jgi:hypothetical protein
MDDFKPELLKALLDWVRLHTPPSTCPRAVADIPRLGQHVRPPAQNHVPEPARRRPDTVADTRRYRRRLLQRVPTQFRRESPPPIRQLDTTMAEPQIYRTHNLDVHTGRMRAAARSHKAHDTRPQGRREGRINNAGCKAYHGCAVGSLLLTAK